MANIRAYSNLYCEVKTFWAFNATIQDKLQSQVFITPNKKNFL